MMWNLQTDRSCYYSVDISIGNEIWGLEYKDAVSFTFRLNQICFMAYTDPFSCITWTWRSFKIISLLLAVSIMKLT